MSLPKFQRDYEHVPVQICPPPVSKHMLKQFFPMTPYYEPGLQYEIFTDNQTQSPNGEATYHLIIKFKYDQNGYKDILKVFYVVGQLSPNFPQNAFNQPNNPNAITLPPVDGMPPGLIFPLPDLYHALATKVVGSTDHLSSIFDKIRLAVSLDQNASVEFEKLNTTFTTVHREQLQQQDKFNSLESAKNTQKDIHNRPHIDMSAFAEASSGLLNIANGTVNIFDFSEFEALLDQC